ncbi:MAG: ribonuclease HIII [Bacilli bacterium]|jgi:ribonuclease HIII
METVSINVSLDKIAALKDEYLMYSLPPKGDYVIFYAKKDNLTIRIFDRAKRDKDYLKVVFQGENAREVAQNWGEINEKKEIIIPKDYVNTNKQYGSDEVGFGDFFGPLVVVAAYCDDKALDIIHKFDIKDSKKLTDDYIWTIGPYLLENITYSANVIDNKKYNELIESGYNMNKIKAMLHNNVLRLVQNKVGTPYPMFVDKFVNNKKYFEYLESSSIVMKDITFQERGEAYYPSIALASVIARYIFLKKMAALNKRFKEEIPFGAGKKVDEFALHFLKKHGKTALDEITKHNFGNYKKLFL